MQYQEKLKDQLRTYADNKMPVIINGMGADEKFDKAGKKVGGNLILEVHDDYILYEITKIQEKQEDSTKERILIQITPDMIVSEGTKKIGTLPME